LTDTVANAIRVAKILTGEIEEDMDDSGKDKAAQELGRKGGAAGPLGAISLAPNAAQKSRKRPQLAGGRSSTCMLRNSPIQYGSVC
jgi:hypothetical protein